MPVSRCWRSLVVIWFVVGMSAVVAAPTGPVCTRPLRVPEPEINTFALCTHSWMRLLLAEVGCELEIRAQGDTTRLRRLLELQNGNLDLLAGASVLEERKAYASFSNPYMTQASYLFAVKGAAANWPVQRLCDDGMKDARLVGPASGWFGAEWEQIRKQKTCGKSVELYSADEAQAVKMLQTARADLLLAPEAIFANLALMAQLEPIVEVHREPVALMFRHGVISADGLPRINAALKKQPISCGFLLAADSAKP